MMITIVALAWQLGDHKYHYFLLLHYWRVAVREMPIQTMMSLKNHNDKNGWLPIQKNCDGINSKKTCLIVLRLYWREKCNLKEFQLFLTRTHFYVTKWQIRLELAAAHRNVLDTLYGQKVLLLKQLLLQVDLVAHPRTFAVISHFFPLTSSVFFPMVLR